MVIYNANRFLVDWNVKKDQRLAYNRVFGERIQNMADNTMIVLSGSDRDFTLLFGIGDISHICVLTIQQNINNPKVLILTVSDHGYNLVTKFNGKIALMPVIKYHLNALIHDTLNGKIDGAMDDDYHYFAHIVGEKDWEPDND